MRNIVGVLGLAVAMLLTACGGDSTGPAGSAAPLVGEYSLVSIDGQPVPSPIMGSADFSITLTLDENGTYVYKTDVWSNTGDLLVNEKTEGVWSVSGDQITMTPQGDTPDDEEPTTARYTLKGGTLTLFIPETDDDPARTEVWQRTD